MTTLDALRTWKQRNPDGDGNDWRAAQGNGWRAPETTPAPPVPTPAHRLDNTQAAARVASIQPNLFVQRRPRGDRLVYVLLNQLTELDAEAGRAGRAWYDANRENLTVDRGSEWILRIRAKIEDAKKANTGRTPNPAWAEWRTIAAGLVDMGGQHGAYFAIRNKDGANNDLAFYRVTKWDGPQGPRYGLRQVIGGQGDVKISDIGRILDVGRRIAEDPKEAMLTYGRHIGRCGHCHRTLTNQTSRDAGIGPRCRKGKGW